MLQGWEDNAAGATDGQQAQVAAQRIAGGIKAEARQLGPSAQSGAETAPVEPRMVPDAEEVWGAAAEGVRETAQLIVPRPLQRELVGNVTLGDALMLLLIVVGGLLAHTIARRLLGRLKAGLKRNMPLTMAAEVVGWVAQAVSLGITLLTLFLLLSFLPLPREPVNFYAAAWRVYMTLFVVFVGVMVYHVVEVLILLLSRRTASHDRSTLDQSFAPLLRNIAKALIAVLIVVAVVQTWGYNASGLLAGLGIGGLALAFAAQDTVANVFGSFIIYGDRPYRVGDWIRVGEHEGIVEDIGMRSTRVRTFENTRLTVPNRDVTTTTVENFSLRTQRRVRFMLGVLYSTPPEKIEQLRDAVLEMLDDHNHVTEQSLAVRFFAFGESSLDVMVSFYIDLTDYQGYHRVREDIMLRILRYCNAQGIGIAFPTRTLTWDSDLRVVDAPREPDAPVVPAGLDRADGS